LVYQIKTLRKPVSYWTSKRAKHIISTNIRRTGGSTGHEDRIFVTPMEDKEFEPSLEQISNIYGVDRSTVWRHLKPITPQYVRGFLKNKWKRRSVTKLVYELVRDLQKTLWFKSKSFGPGQIMQMDLIRDMYPIEFWLALTDLISQGIYVNLVPKVATKTGINADILQIVIDEYLDLDRDDIQAHCDEQKILKEKIDILANCGAKMTAKRLEASVKP